MPGRRNLWENCISAPGRAFRFAHRQLFSTVQAAHTRGGNIHECIRKRASWDVPKFGLYPKVGLSNTRCAAGHPSARKGSRAPLNPTIFPKRRGDLTWKMPTGV